jgi:hypothetical protein
MGLGMVAEVKDAEAARITAVTLSTPSDSGALRGIDSVFVATATVFDINVPDSLSVVMYLVTAYELDDPDMNILEPRLVEEVVAQQTSPPEVTDFGAEAQIEVIRDAYEDGTLYGEAGGTFAAGGVVAVLKRVGLASTLFVGDADSVASATTADGATFTWYGRFSEQVGTVAQVRVAAFALDGPVGDLDTGVASLNEISNVVTSAASQEMSLDGDRPTTGTATFGNADFDLDVDGTLTTLGQDQRRPTVLSDLDPDNPGELTKPSAPLDGAAVGRVNGRAMVDGFTDNASKEVLGIGDSVSVRLKMDTSAEAVLLSDSLTVVADLFGKAFTFDKGNRVADTLRFTLELSEGLFGAGTLACCAGANDALTDTFEIFYVDKAGNRSSAGINEIPAGLTATVAFMVDTKAPVLDGVAGDTILPVSTDTITDGTLRNSHPDLTIGYPDDVNAVQWILAEALDTLFITFDGADTDITIGIPGSLEGELITGDPALLAGSARTLDFTAFGIGSSLDSFTVASVPSVSSVVGAPPRTILTYEEGDGLEFGDGLKTGSRVTYTLAAGITDSSIVTGIHTVKFRGRDFGGNLGPELSRTNVYLDVDDIDLGRLFPSKAAFGPITGTRQDTIEEETSKVIFQLSEPADSVLIVYQGISGPDNEKTRTRRLSGTELTKTDGQQTFQIDSLANGTEYLLAVLARDLAGNFVRSRGDTFLYDTSFVVPLITRFTISAEKEAGLTAAFHRTAGDSTVLTVQADATTDGTREAVTYRSEAILKVVGGTGVSLTGTGVTDAGGGRATLNSDDWVTGRRTVTLIDTASIDTLTVSIVDSTTSGGPFAGALDSVIVYDPADFSQIVVAAPATATQGTAFWVGLTVADRFNNTRTIDDDRYVTIAANKLGVDLPVGDILVKEGSGGFWANSTGFSGVDLVFTARTLVSTEPEEGAPDTGGNFIDGKSASVNVAASGTTTIDAPDTLIAADYTGADGSGDQGGFVMLTFDNSSSHETLTAYRVWREVSVSYRTSTAADSTTSALVALAEPTAEFVPWAKVDAVPGVSLNNVIVATLDNVETRWAVSAESGRTTSASTTGKQAFGDLATVGAAYDLMAETMVESKQAIVQVEGPVFANLTPEALAYVEKGIALRLKDTESATRSSIRTYTEGAIRAVDNIAPEPVAFLRALDTPSDAGSSVSLLWSKSESDRMMPRFAAGAVGNGTIGDQVAGVKGYNVYRKIADGEFALVGKAGAGETTFTDLSAFNGIRYTYAVTPYDEDNLADGGLERTAMAIRNHVIDKSGKPVIGLFGADSRVGFDDFFIFSDNFGLDAGSQDFEPAFDLSPNNKIDFDDFFVFVDYFGRSIEASGKVVPLTAGRNSEASLYLEASAALPRVGEEMAIEVELADFVGVKGYGFTVNYDAETLEFVKLTSESSVLGETELAQPRIISKTEGTVSVAAYGQTVDKGELDMSLIFRSTAEIEDGRLYFSEGELRDGNFAVNQVARLGEVQIQTRPEAFALANNYPNPFNPETTIKYALPDPVDVRLEIYNMLGQQVRTLVAEPQNAGRYTVKWDATNESGHSLSTGIYFYRLVAGEFHKVEKMLLLK